VQDRDYRRSGRTGRSEGILIFEVQLWRRVSPSSPVAVGFSVYSSRNTDFADETVAWCGSELYLSTLVTHVDGNSGVMLIQYLSGDAADRFSSLVPRVISRILAIGMVWCSDAR